MRSTIVDRFPIAEPDTFWREIFFSVPVQESIYREGLGCPRAEVVKLSGDLQRGLTRRFVFEQRLDAPGPLKKIFGRTQTLTEEGRYDPASRRYEFSMRPDGALSDKLEILGKVTVEPAGEGHVDRTCELDFRVRIFGVGSLAERFIAHSNQQSYAKRTELVRNLIRDRGLS